MNHAIYKSSFELPDLQDEPRRFQGGGKRRTSQQLRTEMESINLLHCIDRSAGYSNRRSYLLLRRQAAPGRYRLLQSGEISQNACSIV